MKEERLGVRSEVQVLVQLWTSPTTASKMLWWFENTSLSFPSYYLLGKLQSHWQHLQYLPSASNVLVSLLMH